MNSCYFKEKFHTDYYRAGDGLLYCTLDFRRFLESGLRSFPRKKLSSGEDGGLISRTAAGNRAYCIGAKRDFSFWV